MTAVKLSQDLPVSANAVWGVVGSFNGLPDWHPAVEKSETKTEDGVKVRTLSLVGGGKIIERLEGADEKDRSYSYSILSSPLPVADYTATIRVQEAGSGCVVEWSSEFTPSGAPESDAAAAIRGVYEAGFENLKKMFGAR